MSNLTLNIICHHGTALIETIKETAGKFELPESADKKPQKGKVIIISDTDDISDFGKVFKCPVRIGDIIFYKNWGSEVFNFDGKDYVNVRFRDIVMSLK